MVETSKNNSFTLKVEGLKKILPRSQGVSSTGDRPGESRGWGGL